MNYQDSLGAVFRPRIVRLTETASSAGSGLGRAACWPRGAILVPMVNLLADTAGKVVNCL
jgi:hypothetical protein